MAKIYLNKVELNSIKKESDNVVTLDFADGLVLTGYIKFDGNYIILKSLKSASGREITDKSMQKIFLEEVLKEHRKTRLQNLDKLTLIEFALDYCQLMDRNYLHVGRLEKVYQ